LGGLGSGWAPVVGGEREGVCMGHQVAEEARDEKPDGGEKGKGCAGEANCGRGVKMPGRRSCSTGTGWCVGAGVRHLSKKATSAHAMGFALGRVALGWRRELGCLRGGGGGVLRRAAGGAAQA
jgi:hypothetical protein